MLNQRTRLIRNRRPILLIFAFFLLNILLVSFMTTAAADPVIHYVDAATGEDDGVCTDPDAPCLTIGYAIGKSGEKETILIAGGIYPENIKLTDGISRTIIGGYLNSKLGWTPDGEGTVIDGRNRDSTVEIRNHSDTRIEAVRVRGGLGQDDPTFGNGCGGFKIQNSVVSLVNVGIRQNNAGTGDGGGLCAAGDDGKIDLLLDKVFVGGNSANNTGGGLQLYNTNTTIINSIFNNNRTTGGDANVMLLIHEDNVTIINSTIANNNRVNENSTGILVIDGQVTIKNSILWYNGQNLAAGPDCEDCFEVTYTDIQQPMPGQGNISEEPLFVDWQQRNFHLRKNSPCINAGASEGAPLDDLRYNPRDKYPDMGALEWIPPDLFLPIIHG